jgi:hypothetical protein
MIENTIGVVIEEALVEKYFRMLVNKVFKILPIIENQEESISVYMESLGCELKGFQELLPSVGEDPSFLSFLSIYKWLADNVSVTDVPYQAIRREVFHAISLCKKMQARILPKEGEVV